jgi:hypothetical protein
MGLHTGEPRVTEEGYVGIDVHRAARIATTAASASASVRRAPGRNAHPASVSLTSRLLRSKRHVLNSRSSCRIATLSGGWAIRRRRAARLKFSSSATATKYRRWRSSGTP